MKIYYRGMQNGYWVNGGSYDVYHVSEKTTISDIEDLAYHLNWLEWSTYELHFLKRGIAPSIEDQRVWELSASATTNHQAFLCLESEPNQEGIPETLAFHVIKGVNVAPHYDVKIKGTKKAFRYL